MPTFKSLESLMNYIDNATSMSMDEVGEEVKKIMKEEIQSQVYSSYSPSDYDRTMQLLNSVEITFISKYGVHVAWRDNGDWTSYAGNHMYAIHGLEMGKTYGMGGYRSSTNLVSESFNRANNEVPLAYKRVMKSKGIPIK